jgi:hypothetical protein
MSKELENLVKIGRLKQEAFAQAEFDGLVKMASNKLVDAQKEALSPESRFDLAYNASHAYALAALRYCGYRSENRQIVFQVLEHTTGMPAAQWRVLSKGHGVRNLAEYEGYSEIDLQLLGEFVKSTLALEALVKALKKKA